MRHRNDSGNFIYLPTNENYTSIYNKYKEYYCLEHGENENIISYSTFRRLWHELMPNLKFQSPASDLCETCEEFKAKMRIAKSDIDKFNIIKNQFEEHQEKADLERQHYNNNIEKSKHELSIAHICYDWAQNVTVPYSPQQVGSIYFKTAYAVHLFGVCKTEGENKQINFVIGENEFPKGVAKGANTTLNMVYQAIKIFAKEGKKNLNINNLSLFFWSWLCILGCSLLQDLGKVYCSEKSGGDEICHKLLRDNNNFDKNEKLNVLDIMPMSDERKKYLYQKIRQHVEDSHKDNYYL
ncbi:hypothetical protein C1646_670112 [Rhizophagus diaphanus]|nr:hypothetical protein C1646_670112 [Rhizophagus diaphanus] [Rhizophagus sp. MUCL 43196]